MSDIEKFMATGKVQTVGDILNQSEADTTPSASPALPDAGVSPPSPGVGMLSVPMIDGYAFAFPDPGIYFGMDEDAYHAVPALSASGIKSMASSPMLYWAKCAWLNPEREEEVEAEHRTLGKAYHCRLLEGADAFAERFAIGLDKADYPSVLESTDDIKGAILKAEARPVTKVPTGETIPDPKKPGEEIPLTRAAVKADWIAQLLDLDPDAQVWSAIVARHAADNAGRSFITADAWRRLAIAAAMIERDDELSRALSGGWPEVSLFWVCPKTGVPMKARVDYLKMRMMVDLKTVANQQEMSIERAIAREIASRKYTLQPSVYFDGADAVRQLVRERGCDAIHGTEEQTAWALKWAKHREPDKWAWIFQQKGIAPVTRGLFYPRGGTTKVIADGIVSAQKRRFREFAERFGVEPWLDLAPIYDIADEDLPIWANDI